MIELKSPYELKLSQNYILHCQTLESVYRYNITREKFVLKERPEGMG